ncbi:hypothetical protein F383_32247 [Gossypium arboreum]|uniref:Uncharacterized protein n=1 Tax=Gossypium arboreum TaxID=29729 RepID=A0A0B0N364_GOSAR|nr:hypothetical protein F383_32247 [Gossypium arboreum]
MKTNSETQKIPMNLTSSPTFLLLRTSPVSTFWKRFQFLCCLPLSHTSIWSHCWHCP